MWSRSTALRSGSKKARRQRLLVYANPGHHQTGAQRECCRIRPNQGEVTAKDVHFIQEDSPHEIGVALADWDKSLSKIARGTP
jgi:hypothetical protein